MIAMARVYPPVWCEKDLCKKCNFLKCDSRVLNLFMPLKYPSLSFDKRPKTVEITSVAMYFGFCQRLAKLFLLFPQESPISLVRENFVNSTTGLPASVSIQRILLDVIDHADSEAPTDNVHRFRLILAFKAMKKRTGYISGSEGKMKVRVTENELKNFTKQMENWMYDLFRGRVTRFEKTKDLNHCRYCFLEHCEEF